MEATNEIISDGPMYRVVIKNTVLERRYVEFWEKNLKNFVVAYLDKHPDAYDEDILVPKYLVDAPFETPAIIEYDENEFVIILPGEETDDENYDAENKIPNYIEEPNHYTVHIQYLGEDDGPPPLMSLSGEEDEGDEDEGEEEDEENEDEEDEGDEDEGENENDGDEEDEEGDEDEYDENYIKLRDEQAYRDFDEGEQGPNEISCITESCTVLVLLSYVFAITLPIFLFMTSNQDSMIKYEL
jgi:hypothetical protein